MSDDQQPSAFLPLTPVAFEILLALADGERHGYAIMRDVERRTGGALRLYPGTLYRTLERLMAEGLLAELEERPDPGGGDTRRRYYGLTELGRRVAQAEAERLDRQVRAARDRNVLPETL